MAFGITPTGFVPKTLADLKADLEAAFRSAFGQGINLSPPSRFATFTGIFAERLAEIWDLAGAVHASFDSDQATGAELENLSVLTGTLKAAAFSSRARAVVLSGTPGTVIAAGKVLSVSGTPASRFALEANATIGGGGTVAADFVGESTGPIVAGAGTLTVIETPVAGWASATNPTDAELGADVEGDAALRVRRRVELRAQGNSAIEAVRGDVSHVAGVTACAVFENVTDGTVDGMPPHSIEVVVSGGVDADIAAAIFASVAGGIRPYGSTSVNVVDSEGTTHAIGFTRPTVIPVYIVAHVAKDPNTFPLDGEAQISAALIAFGLATYSDGVDVVSPRLYGPIAGVLGVLDISALWIGTAPAPTTGARIAVTTRQVAALDAARISLVLTDEVP